MHEYLIYLLCSFVLVAFITLLVLMWTGLMDVLDRIHSQVVCIVLGIIGFAIIAFIVMVFCGKVFSIV